MNAQRKRENATTPTQFLYCTVQCTKLLIEFVFTFSAAEQLLYSILSIRVCFSAFHLLAMRKQLSICTYLRGKEETRWIFDRIQNIAYCSIFLNNCAIYSNIINSNFLHCVRMFTGIMCISCMCMYYCT